MAVGSNLGPVVVGDVPYPGPMGLKEQMSARVQAAFWALVEKGQGDDCWRWTGTLTESGYGRYSWTSKPGWTRRAHRIAYELLVGPIPDGREPDHRCDNRACVRPTHLRIVTHAKNMRAARGKSYNIEERVGLTGTSYRLRWTTYSVADAVTRRSKTFPSREDAVRYAESAGFGRSRRAA